ncbi:MAG TPA: SMP-30/gluconolactonase/LRE family protein [Panacibacter sp.]|nr:SMP-30/gluconolactonase/LRE family protein [Panacibacter sp.]HNP45701.1 SMP-30/gluconolactonase/LRE family protein [Panacibacter sp.]
MRRLLASIFKTGLLLLVFTSIYAQNGLDTAIVAPGAKPVLVSKQFSFTEGPAVDKQGNIFFTDQPNNKIWKYDIEGKLTVFLDDAGRSNGLYFDKKGNIIACADEHNQLWSISPDRKITLLVKDYNGHTFNGPNDLWINSNGCIYFTDPYFQRDYWKRTKPDAALSGEKLYFMKDETSAPVLADANVKKPNGVVGTPDGKFLFVADMGTNKTYRYQINKDGSLSNKEIFVNQSADGITLDEKGNLYLAGSGVTVYNNNGVRIAHINIPEAWTANVCFGGRNKNVLFMTASKAIYILQMTVKGVE